MKRLLQNRNLLRRNLFLVVCIVLTGYFSYHLLMGKRGYFELRALENQIQLTKADFEEIKAERIAIEKKVIMMRPGSICPDLLEERARHVLGYTKPDEYILLQSRS